MGGGNGDTWLAMVGKDRPGIDQAPGIKVREMGTS